MSSDRGLSLPYEISEDVMGSWTPCASLDRFAWVVKRRGISSSALQAVLGRAALSIWLSKTGIRVGREGVSSGPPSSDEEMLDWLVLSVESGWTPREVLLLLFPKFGSIFFNIIAGEASLV